MQRDDPALAEAWNEDRRAAMRAAFDATGLAYAKTSFERVEAQLDAYLRNWSEAREDSCRATHDRGEQSPALLDRSMLCLEQRRVRVSAIVDRLIETDDERIDRAMALVAGLPPLEPCTDRETLLSEVAPPRDAATSETVADLREQLARAASLRDAGDYDAARTSVEQAQSLAGALSYAPALAELQVERGRVLSAQGHYDEATPILEQGYWTAVESRHDRVAANAAVVLTQTVGYQLARMDEGLGWARSAETLVMRAKLGPRAQARVVSSRAKVLDRAGKAEQAVETYESALDLMPEGDPGRLKVLGELGTALQRAGDYPGARRYQEQALELFRDRYGEDHPEVTAAIFNLGAIDYNEGNFESALAAFEEAAGRLERSLGPDHPKYGKALNGVGVVLDDLERYEEAIEVYQRSISILRAAYGDEHPEVAARLDNISVSEANLGRFDVAARHKREALAILRKTLGDEHPDVALAYYGMGSMDQQRGDWDAALENGRKAIEIWEKAHGPDHPAVADGLIAICSALLQSGHEAHAIEPCERALKIRQQAEVGTLLLAEARLRLGQALWWGKGDRARARELLTQAREGYAADPVGKAELESIDGSLREMGFSPQSAGSR